MRDGRAFRERRVLWATAFVLLVLMLAVGSCAAGGTVTPDRSGAQTTLTRTPPRQAAFTPTRSVTETPARAATRRAPASPTVALSGLPTIQYDRLPVQARETIDLVLRGGPFPYRQDGAVFQNRERRLPNKPNGYYHEYTVVTPGSADRGARRIIAGQKDELYYTDDHYDSFKQVLMP
jgi:ribonuclease T1